MFPFGEPVVFEARVVGAEDSHGNLAETFGAPFTVDGCAFDPGGSVESVEPGRNAVVSNPRVFVPDRSRVASVTSRSRATVRGTTYLVDGKPADWRNPFTGREPGVVVNLEAVDG